MNKELSFHIDLVSHISIYTVGIVSAEEVSAKVREPTQVFIKSLIS